jgi:N12 class adenine-specific DNA methylase
MAEWRNRLGSLPGADLTKLASEAPPKEEQGAFSRGLETAARQIPQTAGGALALGADLVGASRVREFGLGVYNDQAQKIEQISRPSDSFSNVLEGQGSPVEFLKYGAGYVGGQALSAVATGGAGALVARKLVERNIAQQVSKEVAAKQMARAMGVGAGTALGVSNLTQTAGAIFPEALEQAALEGRELDGGDKARVVGSALASAGMETAMDMVGLGKVGKILKGEGKAGGLGKRVATEVPAGMAREGVTEGIQTGIERFGAGKAVTGEEASREYVDSVALGALGGGLVGAAASIRSQKQPEIGPLTGALNAGLDDKAAQLDEAAAKLDEAAQSAAGREALAPLAQQMVDATAKQAGVDRKDAEQILADMHRQAEKDLQDIRTFGREEFEPPVPIARLDRGPDLGLQNRDRTRPASVAQMNAIASNPDYDRLGVGRSPNEAAPLVSVRGNADVIPAEDFGSEDRVTLGDGSKIGFRYAVVEADSLLASHRADGSVRPEYFENVPDGAIQALNNGRIAGLQEAYARGTAQGYREAMAADARAHGVSPDAILGKSRPVLVRVYDDTENTRPNLGQLSNPQSGLGFAASETALNDAGMLDVSDFELGDKGQIDTQTNRPVLSRFANAIAASGGDTANVFGLDGKANADFVKRFRNALFAKAYRDQGLVEMATDDADPDIKNILQALTHAAPGFAKIADAADLEIRPNLIKAVGIVRDARYRGLTLEQYTDQADWLGKDEAVEELVRFLWANNRAPKRLGEGLKAIAQFIEQELEQRQTISLLGDDPATIDDVKTRVNQFLEANYGDIQRIEEPEGNTNERASQDGGQGGQPTSQPGAEAEVLTTYTPEELRARAKTAEGPKKNEAPAPDDFVLTGSDAYIDELEARGQMALFEQLALDFEASIASIVKKAVTRPDANDQAKKAAKGSLQSLAQLIRRGSLLAARASEQIRKASRIDLIGQPIRSARDLAAAAQIYRDTQFETLRYVFVKDGKVIAQTAVSSRLSASAAMFPEGSKQEERAFVERMKAVASEADGYYLLHNHPSGNPDASRADLQVTKYLASVIPGLKGHVVIDTDAYTEISPEGKPVKHPLKTDAGVKRQGVLAESIAGPSDVARLGVEFKKPGWVTLIAADAQYRINAVMEIPAEALADADKPRFAAMISKFTRTHGADTVFVANVEGSLQPLVPLVESGFIGDAANTAGVSLRLGGVNPMVGTKSLGRGGRVGKVVMERYNSPALSLEELVTLTRSGSKTYQQSVSIAESGKTFDREVAFGEMAPKLDARLESAATNPRYAKTVLRERQRFVEALQQAVPRDVQSPIKDYLTIDLFGEPEQPKKPVDQKASIPEVAADQFDFFIDDQPKATVTVDTPAYVALKEAAKSLQPAFASLVNSLAQGVSGSVKIGPLKGDKRALQKINGEYRGDVGRLKDMLRATVIAPDVKAVTTVFKRLLAMPGAMKDGSRNWFVGETPDALGYRDAKVNLRIGGVIVEIQVSTQAMLDAKTEGHKLYEKAREISEAIELEQRVATPKERSTLDALYADSRALYDNAFKSEGIASGNLASKASRDSKTESPPSLFGVDATRTPSESTAIAPLPSRSTTGMPSTSQNQQRESQSFIDASNTVIIPRVNPSERKSDAPAPQPQGLFDEPDLRTDLPRQPEGEPAEGVRGAEGTGGAPKADGGGRGSGQRSDAPDQAETGGKRGSERDSVRDGEKPSDSGNLPRSRVRVDAYQAPRKEGLHYRITDVDSIGRGGLKQKYRDNIAAIKLLKTIEAEGRLATADEQAVLVKYVGWGGMKNAFFFGDAEYIKRLHERGEIPEVGSAEFTSKKFYWERGQSEDWADERREVIGLLDANEYKLAAQSTPNAHYTAPQVILAMWDALKRIGFNGGRVLEPAMGVGHFFGLMPQAMQNASALAGVELDSITGRIAKQLYQTADVRVEGFEKAAFPSEYFDLAISNVPFGDYQVSDPKFDRYKLFIHDYFFMKALDRVRPGGLVAFITSDGTLDKLAPKARQLMAKQANLVGAIRLPNNAFKENAATEVTTDIIFLRKLREGESPADLSGWKDVKTLSGEGPEKIAINEYFIANPGMMMGTMTKSGTMYGANDQALVLKAGEDLASMLQRAIAKLPDDAFEDAAPQNAPSFQPLIVAPDAQREGTLLVRDGKVVRVEGGLLIGQPSLNAHADLIKAANTVRSAMRAHFAQQISDTASDAMVQASMKTLNQAYDAFVAKHGQFSSKAVEKVLASDADAAMLMALERLDKTSGKYVKAEVFTKRTVSRASAVTQVDSPVDALNVSLNERGKVDLAHMSAISGYSEAELIGGLQDRIFQDPVTREYLTSEQYLSGQVRQKLRDAQAAAKVEPTFERNVQALEGLVPASIPLERISVSLGQSWVPADVLEDFVHSIVLGPRNYIRVSHVPGTSDWRVNYSSGKPTSARATTEFGTPDFNAIALIEKAMNLQQPTAYGKDSEGKQFVREQATMAAREKQEAIVAEFKKFVVADPERVARLEAIYNEQFNGAVLPTFNGAHMTLPGVNPNIKLRGNVLDGAWRIVSSGMNTLLAHAVGAGKTFTMIAGGMELKRLGLVKKPMYVVPNHMLMQFSTEFRELYPAANILIASKEELDASNRKRFLAKIATQNWDAVVITHRSFQSISMSNASIAAYIRTQIAKLEDATLAVANDKNQARLFKQLQKRKKDLQAKLEKTFSQEKKDAVLNFEELGVDQLFVDEAHYFKNLAFVTKMDRVAGLTTTDAERSQDMFLKTQYVTNLHGGRRGVVFATGTPIANSVTELYTMQRYLDMRGLQQFGLQDFDAWAAQYGETVSKVEPNPTGSGYRIHKRFSKFKNVPELMQMFRRVADIKTPEMLNLPVPKIKGGKPDIQAVEPSQEQVDFVQHLAKRAEAVKDRRVKPSEDNMLLITTDGRKAALDLRLVIPDAGDHPGSKINEAVCNIARIWKSSNTTKSSQLVFCDLSVPKADGSFSVYQDIKAKLLKQGIPDAEVQFIQDFDTDIKKDALFEKVRDGRVRVLIGSTDKMGAGTNIQRNLIAEHHLDAPWRPADVEQRDGRLIRQGNQNPEVELIRYVTQGTFDVYSWQTLETKQGFIGQVMRGDTSVRELEDADGRALSYAEVKALAMGDSRVLEKVAIEAEIAKLSMAQTNHDVSLATNKRERAALESVVSIKERWIARAKQDLKAIVPTSGDQFAIRLGETLFSKRGDAAQYLELTVPKPDKYVGQPLRTKLGRLGGFELSAVSYGNGAQTFELSAEQTYSVDIGDSWPGAVARLERTMARIPEDIAATQAVVDAAKAKIADLQSLADKPFEKADRLSELVSKLREIDTALGIYKDEAGAQEDPDSVEEPSAPYGAGKPLREAIAAEFKKQTGKNIEVAGTMLAGIEMRNSWRSNGTPAGNPATMTPESNPFSKAQMAMIEAYERAGTTATKHLYHATPASNLDSIRREGLVPGKPARHRGVSSSSKVSFGLTKSVAMLHGAKGDVLLRTKRTYSPENLEPDLLASGGADGSLVTNTAVPPEALEVFQGGKWAPLVPSVEEPQAAYGSPVEHKIKARIGDFLKTKRSFNTWWHRTVGTQFHKASISPEFKKVFDLVQGFISNVSRFANDAADLAPTVLPRLDKFSDLKRKPLSKEDNERLQKAVFDGTLLWTRNEQGEPVLADAAKAEGERMTVEQKAKALTRNRFVEHSTMRMWLGMTKDQFAKTVNASYEKHFVPKAGIVWTAQELKSMFNYTKDQVKLYFEFRAATDKSINDLAKTEMLNRVSGLDEDLSSMVHDAPNADAAGVALRDHLFAKGQADLTNAEYWDNLGNDVVTIGTKAQGLIDRGYAPLMRFGRYTVYVTKGQEQVYFGIFESEADANKMARELAAPDVKVEQGVLSEEAFKIMSGMTPDTMELFAELTGVEKTEAFADFIRLAKNNRSAMKRLLERKGVAGFSTDASRVLASFVMSNARASSTNLHMGKIQKALADIPKEMGDVKDEAVKLAEYVRNPIEEAARIRGLLFFQYLGGSVASAMVNMTQPVTMTLPYLSQFVGARRSASGLAAAMKDALAGVKEPRLKAALDRAERDGLVSPQEIHQLQGEASRQFGSNVWVRRVSFLWGSLFSLAEQYNRRVTFIAAYRAAQAIENADPYGFASKAIEETQGIYTKANKPNWARGAVGSTLFTFKQYSISYMEFLKRLPPKERVLALAVLVAASGIQGLPFSDDLDDLIDTLAQHLGYAWNTKEQKTKLAAAVLGRDGAEFVLRGASAFPGFPIDVAGRLGMSNLLPGTGMLLKSKQDKAGEVFEALGPAGGIVRDAFKGEFFPLAVRNAAKGIEMAETGWYKDTKGRNVMEVDALEAIAKGIGFQPARVARETRAVGMAQQNVALARTVETELADRMATARMEQNPKAYQAAQDDLREWNAANPQARIRITSEQIARRVKEMRLGRSERVAKAAPRELRGEVQELINQ